MFSESIAIVAMPKHLNIKKRRTDDAVGEIEGKKARDETNFVIAEHAELEEEREREKKER